MPQATGDLLVESGQGRGEQYFGVVESDHSCTPGPLELVGAVAGIRRVTSHSRKPCPLGRGEWNPCRGIIKGAGGLLYPSLVA